MIFVAQAAEALGAQFFCASARHEQGKGNVLGRRGGLWGPSPSLSCGMSQPLAYLARLEKLN